MGVMAIHTPNPGLGVTAQPPFMDGGGMTGATKFVIRANRHYGGRMVVLHPAMAGFAGNPFMGITTIACLVTGGMAHQTITRLA